MSTGRGLFSQGEVDLVDVISFIFASGSFRQSINLGDTHLKDPWKVVLVLSASDPSASLQGVGGTLSHSW